MTISFTRTRQQLADLVLGKLGVKAGNVSASSADMEIVYEACDLRLKEMHALGIFWRNVTTRPFSFSVTSGVASASATADVLFPIQMTVLNGSVDENVEIISIRDYAAIPDKSTSGFPEKVVYDGGAQFVFWPVPNANTTAKLIYQKIADDTENSAAPDVDVSMLRSLKDMVAFDCADHWNKSEAQIARFEREATRAERRIRNLSAQRVDVSAVQVDDHYDTHTTGIKRDWNFD